MVTHKQLQKVLIVCGLLVLMVSFLYYLEHPLIRHVTRIKYSGDIYSAPLGKQCANEWKAAQDMDCVNRGRGIEVAFAATMTKEEVEQFLSETELRSSGYLVASELNKRHSYIVGIDVPTGEEQCWERELPKLFTEIESAWAGCDVDREGECCVDWGAERITPWED